MSDHTHNDDDRLTFGCPACIDSVYLDQEFSSMDGLALALAYQGGAPAAEAEASRRYGHWSNWPAIGDFL